MAESPTPSPTPSDTSKPAPLAPSAKDNDTPKQYIRTSTDDNALEPDALRGSEQVIKDSKIQDDEADRRKVITPEEKK
jgi:hypothetical protein